MLCQTSGGKTKMQYLEKLFCDARDLQAYNNFPSLGESQPLGLTPSLLRSPTCPVPATQSHFVLFGKEWGCRTP